MTRQLDPCNCDSSCLWKTLRMIWHSCVRSWTVVKSLAWLAVSKWKTGSMMMGTAEKTDVTCGDTRSVASSDHACNFCLASSKCGFKSRMFVTCPTSLIQGPVMTLPTSPKARRTTCMSLHWRALATALCAMLVGGYTFVKKTLPAVG